MLLPAICCLSLLWAITISQVYSTTPSCLDDDGNKVDWFIAYKFPVLKKQDFPFNTGYAYAYMTSKTIGMNNRGKAKVSKGAKRASQWTISEKLITEPDSMVLNTLGIAYEDQTLNSIYYNDHPPTAEVEENNVIQNHRRAHAKGAVVVDDNSGDGFWLSHSSPQFPAIRVEKLDYADNSRIFGQTFICLNFDLNESGKAIFEHLINMRPLVYESRLSDDMMSWMPELSYLEIDGFKGKRADKGDGRLAQVIKTRAGQELSIFSKSGSFNDDLFAGWLDDELGSSLMVETWRNGNGNTLSSSCPRNEPHINNVEELKVVAGDVKIFWTYRQDHSKWAISESEDTGVVCLSDINRAESQFTRGGGAICIRCPKCWNIFSNTILELEPCPAKST